VPGALDSLGKKSLMRRADSADPAGEYFPALGNEVPQEFSVLEVDVGDLLSAELAYSLTPNTESFWSWHELLTFLTYDPDLQGADMNLHIRRQITRSEI
jgi:hypothetical protein